MKTAHQLARELLKGPDLPIYHFDPSRAGMGDEDDPSLTEPKIERVNPRDGMSAREIKEAREEGYSLKPFLTIGDSSDLKVEDEPAAFEGLLHDIAIAAGMLTSLQQREIKKIAREMNGARLLGRYETPRKGDLHWDFDNGHFVHLSNPLYVGQPINVGDVWARQEKKD